MTKNETDFFPEITDAEVDYEIKQQKQVFFESRFKFLQQHNGIRPGCIHLFIALSGNGKSTLMKSIIGDLVVTKKKFMIILSEESRVNYMAVIRSGIPDGFDMSSVPFFSEVDTKEKYDLDQEIVRLVKNKEIEVVVYDNISTSEWYGDPAKSTRQAESFKKIKTIASETGVAFLLVAHVGAKIKESYKDMIDQNDIEGSRAPIKMAEFIYIIQRFTIKEKIFTTLRIAKNRTHSVKERIFMLNYNENLYFYDSDKELSFESFNKLFKERNKVSVRDGGLKNQQSVGFKNYGGVYDK